jgi:hypothetical protein
MTRLIAFRHSVPARGLVAAALLLAAPVLAAAQVLPAPSPEPAEESPLISFVPRPEGVFLEQTADFPSLGNTLVILVLASDEVERLKAETGRTDLVAVGPDGQQVVFRDDGLEGDAAPRDFEFTGIAHFHLDDLAERAAEDRTSTDRGESTGVPVFDQRAIVGEATSEPFDIEGFEAGARVALTRSLSISPTAGSPTEEGHEEHGEEGGPHAVVAATHVPGTNQFQDRVLMIRSAGVVQDPARTFNPCTGAGTPMGVWTFGHLATAMANQAASGINPSTFVETWLNEWLVNPQIINGFNVLPRGAMQALINDWRNASGGGPLNLAIAPFRLLAINPRIDLRTTTGGGGGYGGVGSGNFLDAGEARFTFGIVLPPGYVQSQGQFFATVPIGGGCFATRFSVIFEYRVPKCHCEDVRDWARQWRRLNLFVPGTAAYNSRLEALTRVFTDANRNPTRPNRNAIGQVRSNEIALQPPWEIREFQLRMFPWSFLLETTTADTPDDSFNGTPAFTAFVNAVFTGTAGPAVPLFFPLGSGTNFLGAHPQTPNPFTTFWNGPGIPPAQLQTRHLISLGTCNGCHARETDTVPKPPPIGLAGFQHIESFHPAPPALISEFLTGVHVLDPVDLVTVRSFDDLARREIDINAVARMICGHFRPVRRFPIIIGPLTSEGTEVESISAAATTDPTLAPLSVAPEDFLRQQIQQVH